MASIEEIEGIGPNYAAKLKEAGIATTDQLLAKGGAAAGREALAKNTGIGAAVLLEWVNHADLSRIKGIGWEYADLLEEAGVIVAWGHTDIDDHASELHNRHAIGVHSYGNFHSIDPGKLTMAPYFAEICAGRILGATGS